MLRTVDYNTRTLANTAVRGKTVHDSGGSSLCLRSVGEQENTPMVVWPHPLEPLTLEGRFIRLLPLAATHAQALFDIGRDEDIWRFMPYGRMDSLADMEAWVALLLKHQARGSDMPFVVFHRGQARVVGATRFMNADAPNRAIEIGGTWYAAGYRGTIVNPEAKLLLLQHAFERLACVRVQFRTDLRNLRSQRALERLGAVREGVWREHMLLPDGHRRSSVVYSILENEWPAVKAGLMQRVAKDAVKSAT
jgi:RimJ/RimL family protein N-acetyltransferase